VFSLILVKINLSVPIFASLADKIFHLFFSFIYSILDEINRPACLSLPCKKRNPGGNPCNHDFDFIGDIL